ncbi:hypothetical protein AWB78_05332 [Caballeronia calidae]|uniref:Uncharacterized protein n=1 Tax=Caballeronia calidae TaxID=1777139 RepID=A0A158DL56_9BURK|nr:hypothetical protein [Caballeronia calidae]SAK95359.1 hypothetical protein AWB78_05332 [Caballeronia calidae]
MSDGLSREQSLEYLKAYLHQVAEGQTKAAEFYRKLAAEAEGISDVDALYNLIVETQDIHFSVNKFVIAQVNSLRKKD